jgi:hypothetical protein
LGNIANFIEAGGNDGYVSQIATRDYRVIIVLDPAK